jgi:hypothetical protein
MLLLKVLDAGMKSPYKGFEYDLNKWYHCEEFNTDPIIDCGKGYHAIDVEGLPYAYRPGRVIWWCEVGGRSVEYDIYKRRYEKIRITHRADLAEIKQMAIDREETCGYKLSEVIFPFNPFTVYTEKEMTEKIVTPQIIKKLNEWETVCETVSKFVSESVWETVWATVRKTVRKTVRETVRKTVWEPVWESVWETVWKFVRKFVRETVWENAWETVSYFINAYISSLFPDIEKWYGIEHEPGVNPFQSGVDLWRAGFVPSFDGKTWRLHAGSKATVVHKEQ